MGQQFLTERNNARPDIARIRSVAVQACFKRYLSFAKLFTARRKTLLL